METRRQVLQGLIFALGGAAALTAFQGAEAKAETTASGFYTADELALVTFLADTIIPRTDTPGAIDAGVPAYMDHLYLTWASPKTQGEHRAHLAMIAGRLKSASGAQKLKTLEALDAAAFSREWDALGGYRAVKSLIASVYYVSEPGATQELQYEPVPGRWLPSAPIAEIGRTWAL